MFYAVLSSKHTSHSGEIESTCAIFTVIYLFLHRTQKDFTYKCKGLWSEL